MREYQVRICEGLGVKFPGPTRHQRRIDGAGAMSGPTSIATTEAGAHGFDQHYFVQQVAGLSQLAGELMLANPSVIDLGWGKLKSALVNPRDSGFVAPPDAPRIGECWWTGTSPRSDTSRPALSAGHKARSRTLRPMSRPGWLPTSTTGCKS
jgi:hypothetical protein